jgi:hypothetical protein
VAHYETSDLRYRTAVDQQELHGAWLHHLLLGVFAALLRLRAPVALRIGTNTIANSLNNLHNHTESFEAAENI